MPVSLSAWKNCWEFDRAPIGRPNYRLYEPKLPFVHPISILFYKADLPTGPKPMNDSKTLLNIVCVLLLTAVLTACSGRDDAPPEPAAPLANTDTRAMEAPVGRLGDNVVPTKYDIELAVDPSKETYSGNVSIDVEIKSPTNSIWLHGKDLQVTEVYVTDSESRRIEAAYEQKLDSGVALLTLEQTVAAGAASIHFAYTAVFNSSANALFKVERDGKHYAVTQFEPIGARKVFPGFDEPGFKVPFDLSLITRATDVAITTTPEATVEALGNDTVKHVFETTRPLPTYLIAIVVGAYDVVDYGTIPANSVRHRELPLRGMAAHGQGKNLPYALNNTDGILSVLEEYFGTPYPYKKLDLIAMPQSFGGAMENVGAITYDEYLLLMDENSPLNQRRSYTAVHAHEIGHMWFGNLVTPEWWNDIWLNESFASWIMFKAAARYWPEGEFDRETLKRGLDAMSGDSLAAARQIREPVERNEEIGDAFDGITYQKGAGVLAMLERYVGEDQFQAGIRLHMQRHKDGTATAEDFIASLAEGSDRSEIEAAFKSYIEQPGVPLMSVSTNCDDAANPKLEVRQARYAPLGSSIEPGTGKWQVPFCVAYDDGTDRKSSCTLITESVQTIELDANSCPSGVMPNADGAGYYRFAMDEAGWQALIANAADLAAAEALVLADSLDAAFRADHVSAGTYLSGLVALVNHDTWDVSAAAMTHLENIVGIIDSDSMPAVEQALQKIAKPRFERLAGASGSGNELLRTQMQRFLIVIARDQGMREPLARKAALRLGLNGEPDPAAAAASELETIFSIGVQDIGQPFFDLLLKAAIDSDDSAFRVYALGALARVDDPVLVEKLQATLLAGNFKGTEMMRVISRQMVRAKTTELTYAWIRKNYAVLIERIPETFRSTNVPSLGGAFCSTAQADEWQDFVVSNADSLPGYERSLAQATESVRLCAALRDESADELVVAFEAY
jgi:alanyl aminopeptidase